MLIIFSIAIRKEHSPRARDHNSFVDIPRMGVHCSLLIWVTLIDAGARSNAFFLLG